MTTFGNESGFGNQSGQMSAPTGADDANQSDMKQTVTDEASALGSTVGSESKNVLSEAKYQARGLVDESVGQLRSQASTGQQRLAQAVREFAGEAGTMADGSSQNGVASRLASDAARVGDDLAGWLEDHGPDDVMREVRRFAARRPGTFLAISAGLGLLAGRFLRGVRDESAEEAGRRELAAGYYGDEYVGSSYGDARYGGTPYGDLSYDDPQYRDPQYEDARYRDPQYAGSGYPSSGSQQGQYRDAGLGDGHRSDGDHAYSYSDDAGRTSAGDQTFGDQYPSGSQASEDYPRHQNEPPR